MGEAEVGKSTGNGDNLHWKTVGSPNRWTIVVWDCAGVKFREFAPRGLVAFLADLIAGKLKVFPGVFFKPTPRFIPVVPEVRGKPSAAKRKSK